MRGSSLRKQETVLAAEHDGDDAVGVIFVSLDDVLVLLGEGRLAAEAVGVAETSTVFWTGGGIVVRGVGGYAETDRIVYGMAVDVFLCDLV